MFRIPDPRPHTAFSEKSIDNAIHSVSSVGHEHLNLVLLSPIVAGQQLSLMRKVAPRKEHYAASSMDHNCATSRLTVVQVSIADNPPATSGADDPSKDSFREFVRAQRGIATAA